MLRVTVESAGENIGSFALKEGDNVIGRSRSSDIRIDTPDISRAHIKIVVSGDSATIENMSQFGAIIDGVVLQEPKELADGQQILIGKKTIIVFEDIRDATSPGTEASVEPSAGASAPPAEEADEATGIGKQPDNTAAEPQELPSADDFGMSDAEVTGEDIGEVMGGTLAAAKEEDQPQTTSFSEPSRPAIIEGDETGLSMAASADEEFMTRAMQTRVASPEEIDYLKIAEQKKTRQRVILIGGAVLIVAVLAFVFRPRPLPPEDTIEWPRDAQGEYLDALVPCPSGGYKDGGFDLICPGNPGWKRSAIPGGMIIECRIGRKKDVPMRIVLIEERDKRFLQMTREEAIQDSIARIKESGGRWNFAKPSPSLNFHGRDNGIPFRTVSYEREKDRAWFGVASIFLYGPRRFILRSEAPRSERPRAEDIVYTVSLDAATSFVHSHWEAVTELPATPEDKMLTRVRREMQRMAPATWTEIQTVLMSVLTKATMADNPEVEEEALLMLARLRERQALWFNSQRLAKDAAEIQKDRIAVARITDFSKSVFSNVNDKRYYDVRRW